MRTLLFRTHAGRFTWLLLLSCVLLVCPLHAESVQVRHPEGALHGFLALSSTDGTHLADGELTQTVDGSQVTSRAVFHFTNGSLQEETAVFSQDGQFRLISDHLVQRGPIFPQPIDMMIDVPAGRVTVHYAEKDGTEKTASERMDLPADLANGIIPILMKNVRVDAPPKSFSFIAATPEPRLIKLEISTQPQDVFTTGAIAHKADHYVLHADIGGLAGLFAPLVGKQPPDSHVWILGGDAPAFLKAEEPFFVGAPLWRIELVSPVWPRSQP
jgi:hypothetical protein